jgi:hypothetical protein
VLVPADEDREVCRTLAVGQVLRYRFESSAELSFAAHYHRAQEARSLWRKDEIRHDAGELVAALAASYCLYWHNYQERSLNLRYELTVP